MEAETILQASGYIALAIATWSVCKYFLGPLATNENVFVADRHERLYKKTIEERGRVAVELGRAGKSPEEISDVLEINFPFPEEPSIR